MLPISRRLSGEDREEKLLPDADLATMTEETLGIVYRLTTPRKKIRSCTRHVMIVCADPRLSRSFCPRQYHLSDPAFIRSDILHSVCILNGVMKVAIQIFHW